jgi:hypothetical protein
MRFSVITASTTDLLFGAFGFQGYAAVHAPGLIFSFAGPPTGFELIHLAYAVDGERRQHLHRFAGIAVLFPVFELCGSYQLFITKAAFLNAETTLYGIGNH